MDLEKQKFLQMFREVYNNPEKFVQKQPDGTLDCSKLATFFNSFIRVYLQKDMEGITTNFPQLFVKKFTRMGMHSRKTKESSGCFSSNTNTIDMNAEKFENLKGSQLRDAILTMLPIVCHEFQHFKQYVYLQATHTGELNLNESQMSALRGQFGSDPDVIAEDCKYGALKSVAVKFAKQFDPEIYAKAKNADHLIGLLNPGEIGADRVLKAQYFLKPNEVDARESSIKYYDQLVEDVEVFNFTHGEKFVGENGEELTLKEVPVSKLKRIGNIQRTKNAIDNRRHSANVMQVFDEQMRNMQPEQIIKYLDLIDKKYPQQSTNPEVIKTRESVINDLSALIEVAYRQKGIAGAEFLSKLSQLAKGHHKEIIEKYIQEIQNNSGRESSVSPVSKEAREQEKGETQESTVDYQRSQRTSQTERSKEKIDEMIEERAMSRFDD